MNVVWYVLATLDLLLCVRADATEPGTMLLICKGKQYSNNVSHEVKKNVSMLLKKQQNTKVWNSTK